MSTTFISPDFASRPYAPSMNQNGGNSGQNHGSGFNSNSSGNPSGIATSSDPQQYVTEPVKGGFTDFIRDNKVMVIIFVLVVVIIICVLIWWMTRGKPTPPVNQGAPDPPQQRAQPRPLPPQSMQGAPQDVSQGPSQQMPPQRAPQPLQPPVLQQSVNGIETTDDKELNRFMHLDESSISESDDESDNVSVGGSKDDESEHDSISDSWSVESSDE